MLLYCSWVTDTNICKGSHQATRALRPCKCSCGYPSCRLPAPWDDSCISGQLRAFFTSHFSPGPAYFLFQRLSFRVQNYFHTSLTALETCTGPGTSLPCHVAMVLEDTTLFSLCFAHSLRAPHSREVTAYQFCAANIGADWWPGQRGRAY